MRYSVFLLFAAIFSSIFSLAARADILLDRDTFHINEFVLGQTQSKLTLPEALAVKVPFQRAERVLVDMDQRRMFLRQADGGVVLYRVGIGRPEAHIPLGRTRTAHRRVDPSWWPTPRARRRDPTLPSMVRSSADNPLGSRAINLRWKYYLIHGTNDPAKIGRGATWGCVSLYESEVHGVFDELKSGTGVRFERTVAHVLGQETTIDEAYRQLDLATAALGATRIDRHYWDRWVPNGVFDDVDVIQIGSHGRTVDAWGDRLNAGMVAKVRAMPDDAGTLLEAQALFADLALTGNGVAALNLAFIDYRLGNLKLAKAHAKTALSRGERRAGPLLAYFATEGIGGDRDLSAAFAFVAHHEGAGGTAMRGFDVSYVFSPSHWKLLQQALKNENAYGGAINGLFKDESRAALSAYAQKTGIAPRVSLEMLASLGILQAVTESIREQRYIHRY